MTKLTPLLILLLTIMFLSCNKLTPAGFWKGYKSKLLVENISDQGPYGGHRAMLWKSKKPYTFNSANVIDFATKHSWDFVDSFKFKAEQIKLWKKDNKPVFPFSYTRFSDTMTKYSTLEYFPRWINSEITVLKFETDWEAIEPGNAKQTEENGFAVINKDGTGMSVYHLWGE